jgi:hypothetical protein
MLPEKQALPATISKAILGVAHGVFKTGITVGAAA